MQHRRRNGVVESCARHGFASPAVYASLLLSCAWCAACAQGADQGGGDDGGSDDSSGPLDTSSPPVDSASPPARDATGSSSGTDAPVSGDDATEAGEDTGIAEGRDSAAEGAPDASMDSPIHVQDASVDAVADSSGESGSDAPADSGCGCRRVFVSSTTFTGNLGGAIGADMKCSTLAMQANLGGSWMAWISDATTSPSARFTQATVQYRRLDGVVVALNYAALASGLQNPIDIDEHGNSLAGASSDASKTWTGTVSSGAAGTSSCTGFTVTTGTGEVGHCTSTGTGSWSPAYQSENCSVANHLYCFEQ